MTARLTSLVTLLIIFSTQTAWAQGQDSTPGERYLRVMAEMLPGVYDNANQNYFDRRRQLPEESRHKRLNIEIRRVEAPAFGPHVFLWTSTLTEGEEIVQHDRLATLSAGGNANEVILRHYFKLDGRIDPQTVAEITPDDLRRTEGCDYYFMRRASSFRGSQRQDSCRFEWQNRDVLTNNTIELSSTDLYLIDHKFDASSGERITGVADAEPYFLERSRTFHCYADVPGVGGGRDEPFDRYDGIELHDKGGSHWFTTRDDESRNIGLVLQSVTWQVLNESSGNFNRNSLVVYVLEKLADGSMKDHGYAFTEPKAERIGVNLKWMLVNCSITPPSRAKPSL